MVPVGGRDKPALRPLRNIPSALETWEKYVDGNSAHYFKNTRASEEDREEPLEQNYDLDPGTCSCNYVAYILNFLAF